MENPKKITKLIKDFDCLIVRTNNCKCHKHGANKINSWKTWGWIG